MRVYFATKLRSFFKHLLSNPNFKHEFVMSSTYDLQSKVRLFLISMAKTSLFDWLGFIQIPKVVNKDCDLYGSFNRFLRVDKPYFIYLENPTALYHYRLNRGHSYLGKKKVERAINDNNLKAIIFMSKACARTFESVCCHIPIQCKREVIYPLVPKNQIVTIDFIRNKCVSSNIQLLYIAQGRRFISKGGLEIVQSFRKLREEMGLNVSLHIITSISEVSVDIINMIRSRDGIKLSDFSFSYSELERIYASSHILLQPTSDESFGLTILEAMKSGVPIVATSLYAIPEMVEDGYNGYLTEPHYWFFGKNNIPNPSVWNHRKLTIYSGKISSRIVDFLVDKISLLYNDRALLEEFSINSFNKANSAPFAEDYIVDQWNFFLNSLKMSSKG